MFSQHLFLFLFARYDCGYFVLKFIESWDGKRMLPIKASDMPAYRKLFLKKWMDRQENLINWEELLFNS
jgi:Ulp1 family protease